MTEDTSSKTGWESVDTNSYDNRWKQMEAAGHNVHGEADFIGRFSPASVLDAGCGTGRVAIELARRGCDVVGVDLDEPFITTAQSKAPELDFRLGDLASVQLDRTFDVVAMPGNVMIFLAPNTESQVVSNMASHVSPGGHLVAGFQLGRGLDVATYNAAAEAAGLTAPEHWCSWDGDTPVAESDYAVLVHQRPENA